MIHVQCSVLVWWAHSALTPSPAAWARARLHRPVGHLKIHPAVKVIMPRSRDQLAANQSSVLAVVVKLWRAEFY